MLKTNKNAIRNTAIFPMATVTNQSKLVESNVTQNTEIEKFSILDASRLSGVSIKDLTDFFVMRGYIKPIQNGFTVTVLGVIKGCVVPDRAFNAYITMEGIIRVSSAFAA